MSRTIDKYNFIDINGEIIKVGDIIKFSDISYFLVIKIVHTDVFPIKGFNLVDFYELQTPPEHRFQEYRSIHLMEILTK